MRQSTLYDSNAAHAHQQAKALDWLPALTMLRYWSLPSAVASIGVYDYDVSREKQRFQIYIFGGFATERTPRTRRHAGWTRTEHSERSVVVGGPGFFVKAFGIIFSDYYFFLFSVIYSETKRWLGLLAWIPAFTLSWAECEGMNTFIR